MARRRSSQKRNEVAARFPAKRLQEVETMKIALGADSAGKPLLDVSAAHLSGRPDLTVADLSEPGFYAEAAEKVGKAIIAGEFERAILFCGTGIGVSISANKVPGIRAALTHDPYSAERAAKSNNAQIVRASSVRNSPRSTRTPGCAPPSIR
jgi:RpiB/LacA/LacB family sugar-phosphate isomerase